MAGGESGKNSRRGAKTYAVEHLEGGVCVPDGLGDYAGTRARCGGAIGESRSAARGNVACAGYPGGLRDWSATVTHSLSVAINLCCRRNHGGGHNEPSVWTWTTGCGPGDMGPQGPAYLRRKERGLHQLHD